MENRGYTDRHFVTQEFTAMPKQNVDKLTDFGKRLMLLRKEAGYTQVELAKELKVTQRMISHYEVYSEYPPASLLPKLTKILGISSDELLGILPMKKTKKPDTRLQRRFQQIEKLPAKDKRQCYFPNYRRINPTFSTYFPS